MFHSQWALITPHLVIIVELGMDLHSVRNFMVAALRYGMKSNDYVYIMPWLAHVGVSSTQVIAFRMGLG